MSKNVFASHAEKYFDRGFNIIPVKGKRPLINDWAKFKDVRLSREELLSWLGRWGSEEEVIGLGVVLGHFGGIAIDIDDERLVEKMPMNGNLYKKGSKGLTGLFAWNDAVQNISSYKLDILAAGRQTVMPPSPHPSGCSYEFVMCDDSIGLGDLIEIETKDIEAIVKASKELEESDLKSGILVKPSLAMSVGLNNNIAQAAGRNQKLSEIAYAKAMAGEREDEAVVGLIQYDKEHHSPPWFSDKNEEHGGRRKPEVLAKEMFRRAQKKCNLSKLKSTNKNDTIKVSEVVELPQDIKIAQNSASKEEEFAKLYDDAGPLIQYVWDYCREFAGRDIPAMFVGAGLGLTSTLACNNVRIGDSWPNLFILNLAPSGTGKSFPQKAIQHIMMSAQKENTLGDSEFRSVPGVYKNFEGKPKNVVLAIQDELGSFFDKLNSNQTFEHIVHILSDLWSKGDSLMMETNVSDRSKNTPRIYNPCLNWLGYCTPDAVAGKVDTKFMSKGLGARFLYLFQPAKNVLGTNVDEEDLIITEAPEVNQDVIEAIKYWMNKPPEFKHDINLASGQLAPFNPVKLQMSDKVLTVQKEIHKRSNDLKKQELLKLFGQMGVDPNSEEAKYNPPTSWLVPVLNRRTEQITRLACVHWMSREAFNCENADYKLMVQDFRWAESFYELQMSGLETFANLTFAGEYSGFSVPAILLEEARKYFDKNKGSVLDYSTWYKHYWRLVRKFVNENKSFDQIRTKGEIERTLQYLGSILIVTEGNDKKIHCL